MSEKKKETVGEVTLAEMRKSLRGEPSALGYAGITRRIMPARPVQPEPQKG